MSIDMFILFLQSAYLKYVAAVTKIYSINHLTLGLEVKLCNSVFIPLYNAISYTLRIFIYGYITLLLPTVTL